MLLVILIFLSISTGYSMNRSMSECSSDSEKAPLWFTQWFTQYSAEQDEKFADIKSFIAEQDEKFADLKSFIAEKFANLHDHDRNVVKALRKVSRNPIVCQSRVTVHYVVYQQKIFGISVAHSPCDNSSVLMKKPSYMHACRRLDVSIWSGCPPKGVALLNISGGVAEAVMGDKATAFGYASTHARSWTAWIVGSYGKSFPEGVHFTNSPPEHMDELLYSGQQQLGMSGGGVVNGHGYVGVVRATTQDQTRNSTRFGLVVPFHLFESCIISLFPKLETLVSAGARGICGEVSYDLLPVPMM